MYFNQMKYFYLQSCSGSFHFVKWNSLQREAPCYQNQRKNKYFHPAQSTKSKRFSNENTLKENGEKNVSEYSAPEYKCNKCHVLCMYHRDS